MRSIEGELARIHAGGGTMYRHAIPRSYAPLEERLSSLAEIARTGAGATKNVRYEAAPKRWHSFLANGAVRVPASFGELL